MQASSKGLSASKAFSVPAPNSRIKASRISALRLTRSFVFISVLSGLTTLGCGRPRRSAARYTEMADDWRCEQAACAPSLSSRELSLPDWPNEKYRPDRDTGTTDLPDET